MKAKQIKQKLVELGAWDEFKKEMRKSRWSIKKYFASMEGEEFRTIIMAAFAWPMARFRYWLEISKS